MENAMPWDKIDAAEYKTWNKQNNFDKAIANSKMRMQNNLQMQLIDDNAKWIDERNNVNVYSLQINKFKNEQKKLEETNKKYKSLSDYNNSLPFASLPYEVELMKKDETLKEKRESWFETLSKDVYVEEAIHILDDLNQKPDTKKGFTQRSNKMIKS
jgi:carboxyl-terminal processing protease